MDPTLYLIVVAASALGGAVGTTLAGLYLVASDFLGRVKWEDDAELWSKVRVTARWTNDHYRWDSAPKGAAYGGATLGAFVGVLIPLLIGLHSIFLG